MSAPTALDPSSILASAKTVHQNLSSAELVEHALANGEATLAERGALVARTGKFTGRTPNDKYTVREPASEADIWWGPNQEMTADAFAALGTAAAEAATDGRALYVVDAFGGADEEHRIRVRFIVEQAWHALFIKQLLIRPTPEELQDFEPDWTVLDLGRVLIDPSLHPDKRQTIVALSFAEKRVLILGTQYAGEMKKSIFTVMNYLLPKKGVMSMHCSANIGSNGDTALFFGLSGTGKTTLSADPDRSLIGDDEHGWDDDGIFNIEGGCYAKCINLSEKGEPQIWNSIKFGSVLENVILDDHRVPDYEDKSVTENTRVAYPVEFIPGAAIPSVGGHPKDVIFLTADAFGVLPPISRLTPEQAREHFLNGYTAKVAGTEAGVTEPEATFSACFAQPFLPLPPKEYADLLLQKVERQGATVWLVNTGWTGGPFGVGHRMELSHTRTMLAAVLNGELDEAPFDEDPIFGLSIPTECPGVPAEVLNPRNTWEDKDAYDAQARDLKARFDENFRKFA